MLKKNYISVTVLFLFMLALPLQATLKEVILRNGDKVPEVVVMTTWMNMELLAEKKPFLFWLFIEKVKDPDYEISSSNEAKLSELAMIQNGKIHDLVRSIVLSAIEGEGSEMKLVYPLRRVEDENIKLKSEN